MVGALNLVEALKPVPLHYFGVPSTEDANKIRRYEEAFHRWTATRHVNPFIDSPSATGFEGYYVGVKEPQAADEVALAIAMLGAGILRTEQKLHRYQPRHIDALWRVANNEQYDRVLLGVLNSWLLTTIGRLRPQLNGNQEGTKFRERIATVTTGKKLVYYKSTDDKHLASLHGMHVPNSQSEPGGRLMIDGNYFKAKDGYSSSELNDGYDLMQVLGKFGYPLVNLALMRETQIK